MLNRFLAWYRDPFRQRPNWAEKTIIILTIGIVIVYVGQLSEMVQSGRQTSDLIRAANIQACAATKFAASADAIRASMSDAAKSMQNSSKAAERSSNTAQSALTFAHRQFEIENRPYVYVTVVNGGLPPQGPGFVPPYTLQINCSMQNQGRTPAIHVRTNWAQMLIDPDAEELTKQANRKIPMAGDDILQPETTPPSPGFGRIMTATNIDPIFPAVLKEINAWRVQLVVFGKVTYMSQYSQKTSE